MNTDALIKATGAGLAAQLAMVVGGHFNPAVAQLFAPLGMAISLVAGVVYARLANEAPGAGALGGAAAGGACALLGILVSFLLGDVEAIILAFGTLSSAVTGAIGGALGGLGRKRPS